jgi:glycosyltransferase involved in cell wall biosynthesis
LALTLGVPVLATPVGGLAEFVNSRNGVLVSAATVEALVAGLKGFFENRTPPGPEEVRQTVSHLRWQRTLIEFARWLRPAASDGNAVHQQRTG